DPSGVHASLAMVATREPAEECERQDRPSPRPRALRAGSRGRGAARGEARVTREETAERLRDILARTLGTSPPDPETDLVASGALDSLALVELLVAVEQEFSITFAPDELQIERFRSLVALAEL